MAGAGRGFRRRCADPDLAFLRPRRRPAVSAAPGREVPARPSRARLRFRPRSAGLDTFALKPAERVLDLVEFHGKTPNEAFTALGRDTGPERIPAALDGWTRHAVGAFLTASVALAQKCGLLLEPCSREWAVQDRLVGEADGKLHELCTTGRRYSGDGVRELRILRSGSLHDREADQREVAVAARVLADGRGIRVASWKDPYTLYPESPEVGRVRVTEVGCLDGSHRVLFDGTAEEARAAYRQDAEELLHAVLNGGDYRPGGGCADCRLVSLCPAVPQTPGALQASRGTAWRRSWSVTTSREHSVCARRTYLYSVHLPGDARPEPAAAMRGRAVHAWLERAHRERPAGGCRAAAAPEPEQLRQSAGSRLTRREAALAAQMIGDHAAVCPLVGAPLEARFEPERTVYAFDRTANAFVAVKADLLYLRDGAWVVRETKTTSSFSVFDPITRYPQTALAIVLAAAGVPVDGTAIRHVELELLTGRGPMLIGFDPFDTVTLRRAHESVRARAAGWLGDLEFKPNPGSHCAECRWTAWCAEASEVPAAPADGDEAS